MDLSNLELHSIGFLSTAPDTFNRAKAVIALAESNEEMQQTLVGCGIILLAAALEQAVHTLLSHSGETTLSWTIPTFLAPAQPCIWIKKKQELRRACVR
jgi:hypothetical protein